MASKTASKPTATKTTANTNTNMSKNILIEQKYAATVSIDTYIATHDPTTASMYISAGSWSAFIHNITPEKLRELATRLTDTANELETPSEQ